MSKSKKIRLWDYWDVKAKGFDFTAQVSAPTRAKAIYEQWKKAREAGYRIPWTDFTAKVSRP